jgi:hypothetical protein
MLLIHRVNNYYMKHFTISRSRPVSCIVRWPRGEGMPVTEAEWLAATRPAPMLAHLRQAGKAIAILGRAGHSVEGDLS